MWETRTREIAGGERYQILKGGAPLSFRELFALFERDADFARWYGETLAACALRAFYWEHPPLTAARLDGAAEFVLLDAPALARLRPEAEAFASHFAARPDEEVLTFPNLGGDALLVVPRPVAPAEVYPHLASFLRGAPESQVASLWRATAAVVRDNLSAAPRWLSTAGLGVAWVHLRLDTRPKYYRHGPYTSAV